MEGRMCAASRQWISRMRSIQGAGLGFGCSVVAARAESPASALAHASPGIRYETVVLALALAGTLWAYFRQRTLRRRMARQAALLSQQRTLLQALYDNIPMAMTVAEIRPDGPTIIAMNRQACALYSVEPAHAIGRTLIEIALTADCRRHLGDAITRAQTGEIAHLECVFELNRQALDVTAVPLSRNSTGPLRICVLAADVTVRKQMDAEIAQSRKLRAVGELVGGIAHEFNNLLTPVMLKVGEIQIKRPADAELLRDMDVLTRAVQRTAELTRRLLTFGRKSGSRPEVVSLATIVDGCFDLIQHTVDRRIVWQKTVPPDLPPLYFNATDLNQILLNLLLNARDTLVDKLAGAHSGSWIPQIAVEVASLPPDAATSALRHSGRTLLGWQRLTVRDNGLGIPSELVERIFEPFFTTKEAGKGTGLGLATVWHLVVDASGRIEVDSTPGEGTAFHVLIPVWPQVEIPKPVSVPERPAAPATVLLVEDEPLVAETVAEALRRSGHTVRHFADGAEAWTHLSANLADYELLVIDVNLPGMNGLDMVGRAREREFGGRVLMMSGRFATADLRAVARLKVDQAITKPFTAAQFESVVREALNGAARKTAGI